MKIPYYARQAAIALVMMLASLSMAGEDATAPNAKITTLPEIVVTPSRTARDIRSTPNTVYRLGASEAVTREGIRTTPYILEGIPAGRANPVPKTFSVP